MIPQSEEPLVGSEERRLKEIRRHQKGLVHYIHPMKSLRRSLKATGVHLNSPTQPIGAQTSSGKLKARHAAKNHLGDLRSHLGSHPLSVYLHFILPFRLLLVIRAARSVKYPHFLNIKNNEGGGQKDLMLKLKERKQMLERRTSVTKG